MLDTLVRVDAAAHARDSRAKELDHLTLQCHEVGHSPVDGNDNSRDIGKLLSDICLVRRCVAAERKRDPAIVLGAIEPQLLKAGLRASPVLEPRCAFLVVDLRISTVVALGRR